MKFIKRLINKRFLIFAMVLFTIYIGGLHYKTTLDSINIKNEQKKISQQIEIEKHKNEELKQKQENINSDEYIEKIARDNLGFLKQNEKVYIDAEKK